MDSSFILKNPPRFTQIVNRKMTRSFSVSDSFFLGAKVMKKFRGKWFQGTVDELENDEATKL